MNLGLVSVLSLLLAAGSAVAQDMAANTNNWLEVSNDREAREIVFSIGPIDLPAGAGHHAIHQPPLLTGRVPMDAYLYGFDIELVDADGQPVPRRVLHHVNLIDPDHRELFSPVARRLFAAGGETQSGAMPKLLGVHVESGQRLMVSVMFHNPTGESYDGAKLNVRLKYRERGWVFPISVYPVYIDVMGHLGVKDFDLPPGKSERSWEGSPAIPGRLLAAGGHLHDHATRLRFEDLTEEKVLWEVGPETDETGRVVAVPVGKFWWKGGLNLRPDHLYRLTVAYDNPTGKTLAGGGMGVLGGVFLAERGWNWPDVDLDDPLYSMDLERTHLMATRRSTAMAMGGSDESADAHTHH